MTRSYELIGDGVGDLGVGAIYIGSVTTATLMIAVGGIHLSYLLE